MDSAPQHRPSLPGRRVARALWIEGRARAVLREQPLWEPGQDDVVVRTRYSGVSRGTERLVLMGQVPPRHAARMRAPFQQGDLPWPVSYGYLAVGTVEVGPAGLRGCDVFVLHPHHDRFVVPAEAARPLPASLPPRRAVLAGSVETALNALWDAAPRIGDRVAVIGAGTVGAAVARLAVGVPLTTVDLIDPVASRAGTAAALGVGYHHPDEVAGPEHTGSYDVVVHTSATASGLALALRLAPDDGEVVEVSWFGAQAPAVPLGEDVHTRRVSIRPSQVGAVAVARRAGRSTTDRLDLALGLLADRAFDALLGEDVPFADLAERLPALLGVDPSTIGGPVHGGDGRCAVVHYDP